MKKTGGFTIIELMLYGALLAVFLTIVSQMFLSILDVTFESETYVANELDARYIFSRLAHDIYSTTEIVSPADGIPQQSLSLITSDGPVVYASTSGNLTLQTNAGTYILNSADTTLAAFTVTKIGDASDSASLRVSLTLQAKTVPKAGVQIKTYETTFGTRP